MVLGLLAAIGWIILVASSLGDFAGFGGFEGMQGPRY